MMNADSFRIIPHEVYQDRESSSPAGDHVMKTRQLGRTDMQLTPIGLGTWAIGGGGYEFGWGQQNDADSIKTIHRAIDLGINWIDTAAVYGLGHAEEVIGRAIQDLSDPPWIFTKCSLVWNEKGEIAHSMREASIRREVEASLRRLQVEIIDLYQLHWPDPESEIEEGWRTLTALQQEGKVRYLGVSNFTVEHMKRAQTIARIDSLQPPYSLIRPDIEETILPFCREQNIGVIVYSPMMSGLLSGKMSRERIQNLPDDDWRKTSPEFQEPRLSKHLQLVETLRTIGEHYGRSPGEVAIAWTLHHPAVTGAIVGARRPDQIEEMIGSGTFQLKPAEINDLTEMVNQSA